MQEKEALIGIYDENKNLISIKQRSQVDKKQDILKTVVLILFNNKDEVFMIKTKDTAWKKEKWGGSCATLIRHNEKPEQAAKRVLKRELNLEIPFELIKEKFYNWGGIKRHLSIFKAKTEEEPQPNTNDFYETKWHSIEKAQELIENNQCMPTFEEAFMLAKNQLNN